MARQHSTSYTNSPGAARRLLRQLPGSALWPGLYCWPLPGPDSAMGFVYSLGLFHRDILRAERCDYPDRWRHHFLWREIPRTRLGLERIWKVHPFGHLVAEFRRLLNLRLLVCCQSKRQSGVSDVPPAVQECRLTFLESSRHSRLGSTARRFPCCIQTAGTRTHCHLTQRRRQDPRQTLPVCLPCRKHTIRHRLGDRYRTCSGLGRFHD